MKKSVVIRIAGDSGDGIQLLGEQLTLTAAIDGVDVRTLPDFPAEIRAPAGTLAGVSGFQLAMAEQPIHTAGEQADVLVALNPAALKSTLDTLIPNGLVILNQDNLTEKDCKKAGTSSNWLKSVKTNYQVIEIPLISQTLEAVKSLQLSLSEAKKTKNFYVLGVILWLFDFSIQPCKDFLKQKFKHKPLLLKANTKALEAGYHFALTLELSRKTYMMGHVERPQGDYRQITGVEAVSLSLATLATKTKRPLLVAGYPITPASNILHECAKLKDYGVELFQAEDEIAAVGACLGASFGGRLALTCTSGPGFDLKSEMLGLAVVTELPLVVVNVMRAGGSTGLPTKTEQSDLNQALYGRHGEASLPVLAAKTPTHCFDVILEAFTIATKYMTPVVVLMDGFLANAAEPWKIPNVDTIVVPELNFNQLPMPYMRDEHLSRSWNIPGTEGLIHQLGGLEKEGDKGDVSYCPKNHEKMVVLRQDKIKGIAREFQQTFVEGSQDAELLIIGWGSTYASIQSALSLCLEEGIKVAHLHLSHLNPLPKDLSEIIKRYPSIVVAELNQGQLCDVIRSKYLVDAKPLTQTNGLPFSPSRLVKAIKGVLQ